MTRVVLRTILLAWLGLFAQLAGAHEFKPVFLRLEEQTAGRVELTLKLPVFRSGEVAAIEPQLSGNCAKTGDVENFDAGDGFLERWHLQCDGGLAGRRVRLRGFTIQVPDGLIVAKFLDGHEASYPVGRNAPEAMIESTDHEHSARSLAGYVLIGIEHIAFGIDHLMFVLGLILVWWRCQARAGMLIASVTAFTLAHSLTLALAVLGGITLPPAPVESLIALSILLLATELVRAARLAPALPHTLTFSKPWLIAFCFGLLHGFGFAGALQETGLPEQARGWALLLFNCGVEIGQLLFISTVVLLYLVARALTRLDAARFAVPATWLIGSVSAAWVLDRTWQVFTS